MLKIKNLVIEAILFLAFANFLHWINFLILLASNKFLTFLLSTLSQALAIFLLLRLADLLEQLLLVKVQKKCFLILKKMKQRFYQSF